MGMATASQWTVVVRTTDMPNQKAKREVQVPRVGFSEHRNAIEQRETENLRNQIGWGSFLPCSGRLPNRKEGRTILGELRSGSNEQPPLGQSERRREPTRSSELNYSRDVD